MAEAAEAESLEAESLEAESSLETESSEAKAESSSEAETESSSEADAASAAPDVKPLDTMVSHMPAEKHVNRILHQFALLVTAPLMVQIHSKRIFSNRNQGITVGK